MTEFAEDVVTTRQRPKVRMTWTKNKCRMKKPRQFSTKARCRGCGIGVAKRLSILQMEGGIHYYDRNCTNTDFIKGKIDQAKGSVNGANEQRTISITCIIIAASEGKSRARLVGRFLLELEDRSAVLCADALAEKQCRN